MIQGFPASPKYRFIQRFQSAVLKAKMLTDRETESSAQGHVAAPGAGLPGPRDTLPMTLGALHCSLSLTCIRCCTDEMTQLLTQGTNSICNWQRLLIEERIKNAHMHLYI